MNLFYAYCGNALLIINAIKSVAAYHGPPPQVLPHFYFNNEEVEIVDCYTYVGMSFGTGKFNVFSSVVGKHYDNKAQKALKVAHAVLHVESMIGSLPVCEGKILYMGCIDPHLIYGCEVTPDTSKALLDKLVGVQLSFFRWLLGLSKTSIKVAVFSETGITYSTPIQFRRITLTIRYLAYLLSRPMDSYVRAALNKSITLQQAGYKTWFGDLLSVLKTLCPDLTLPGGDTLQNAVTPDHSYLLKLRKEPLENNKMVYKTACMRTYLESIENHRHCKALTRLLVGDHSLAVVRLTWTDNHRMMVPHDERVCRFCKEAVETPEHALLVCRHIPLAERRQQFLAEFYASQPRAIVLRSDMDPIAYTAYLASCRSSFSIFAKWVFEVLKIYDSCPLYVPSQYQCR
ncbi:hypothetical protein BT96DRAFT_892074 [Gymnopus androsaceus JB14]|uniref:Reverse transcriptase zinc-binding domain-containing protein n=1 Tax=Gymnopus androsaceus JB14 TaxID=1447944 RepID=A0A6A4GIG8_9AGAR|nr:hypothetical protein BT96DRAFT_892074 [Gymnopus androsaceus JB14]